MDALIYLVKSIDWHALLVLVAHATLFVFVGIYIEQCRADEDCHEVERLACARRCAAYGDHLAQMQCEQVCRDLEGE